VSRESIPSDDPPLRCGTCGAIQERRPDDFAAIVPSHAPDALAALFSGPPNALPCSSCGGPVVARPAVVVVGDGWTELLPGGNRHVEQLLRRRHRALVVHEEYEGFRRAVAGRLKLHATGVLAAILATPDGAARTRLAGERWEELTAEALSAAVLTLSGRLPGTRAAAVDGTPAGDVDVETLLGHEQAIALATLCVRVCADETRVLEDELRRFVAAGLVFEPALELLRRLESREDGQLSPRDGYVLDAIHASGCAAAGVPNVRVGAWAQRFLAFELAQAQDPEEPRLARLRLRPERARATLTFEALWDAVAGVISADASTIDRLSEICTSAGFESMVPELFRTMRLPIDEHTPLEQLLASVAIFHDRAGSATIFTAAVRRVALTLVVLGRADDVTPIVDRALELGDGSTELRGALLAVLGAAMKQARRPRDLLDRLGEQPADWELELSADRRAALWTERSNALRLLGRSREALAIAEEVHGFVEDEDDRRVAELNLAILLRETGEPDRAVVLLEQLLPSCSAGERLGVLESLATTYNFLGRTDDMRRALTEALAASGGPWAGEAPRLRAVLAALDAAQGDANAALAQLDELRDQPQHAQVLVNEASAYAILLKRGVEVDPARVERVIGDLRERHDESDAAGDRLLKLLILQALGVLLDACDDPGAEHCWRQRVELREQDSGSADPLDLVSLARLRWLAGDRAEARRLLFRVPRALAHELGGSTDVSATFDATAELGHRLYELTAVVLDSAAFVPADVRLLSELQRDGAGRARLLREALDGAVPPAAQLERGLDDDVLARLAPERGTLHVIEWLRTSLAVYGLVTRVDAHGRVESRWLTSPRVPVSRAARDLRARLGGWRLGREGDPLEFEPWQALEEWLRTELGDAQADDHVVFIDHADHAGLPWHAIVGVPWTTSYAPSWSALLTLIEASPTERPRRLGVLSVPARGDRAGLMRAFERSLARSDAQAARHGLRLETAVGVQADRGALVQLLNGCELVKLQCHGFVAADDHELALMLADDGDLPLQHTVAAAASGEAGHRYSWRDAQQLDAAPAHVFSAACSTGASLIGGLGERCGMYGALRLRGTRAVVAPAWDGVPDDVLTVLDDTIERHLSGAGSLAGCVKAASEAAHRRLPRWRAWMLALEGDWR
jgi:tetratricopeptide (TPR) repeat protein